MWRVHHSVWNIAFVGNLREPGPWRPPISVLELRVGSFCLFGSGEAVGLVSSEPGSTQASWRGCHFVKGRGNPRFPGLERIADIPGLADQLTQRRHRLGDLKHLTERQRAHRSPDTPGDLPLETVLDISDTHNIQDEVQGLFTDDIFHRIQQTRRRCRFILLRLSSERTLQFRFLGQLLLPGTVIGIRGSLSRQRRILACSIC